MFRYWSVPKLWPDSTVYIIGGGTSLEKMDWSPLHSKRVIGCNDAYTLGPWVDVCYFGDSGWWHQHKGEEVLSVRKWGQKRRKHPGLARFAGLKVTCATQKCMDKNVRWLERQAVRGILMEPDYAVAWNDSTGGSAINFAVRLGAVRIILLGFDMKLGKHGNANWHANVKNRPNEEVYIRFMKSMEHVKTDADRLGVEIINANPDSAMDIFPKAELSDLL